MKDTIWIIVLIISIIAIIAGITFIIYNNNNKQTNQGKTSLSNTIEEKNIDVDENQIGNYLISVNSSDEKIGSKTYVIFNKKYKDCGHIIKERKIAEEELVNLTKEELQNQYEDWEIKSFSPDKVELYKEFPGECGEHYLVKGKNGHIAIYKINIDGEEILLEETEIEMQYLPDEDKENLEKGVKICTEESLNEYIENFE